MNLADKVYNAEIVHRGRLTLPDVEPGLIVLYTWKALPKKHIHPFRSSLVDRVRSFVPVDHQEYALVQQVTLEDGLWKVYLLPHYEIGGDSLPENFRNPVLAETVRTQARKYPTQVQPGDTLEISVVESTLVQKLREKYDHVERGRVKKIVAKVITQASLAENPFVYLSNGDETEFYRARLSDLHQFSHQPRSIVKPIAQIKPTSQPTQIASTPNVVKEEKPQQTVSTAAPTSITSPAEIAEELGKVVRYQETAVRSVAVAVYDHHVRPQTVKKSNVIIVGDTGTGKTELARTMAEFLGVPFAENKLSNVSSTGYKGSNLSAVFEDLYKYKNHPHFNRAVVFLDELDKTVETVSESSGFGPILQNEIIGWSESAHVKVAIDKDSTYTINTTNMLFVAAGAFVGLDKIIAKRLGQNTRHFGFIGQDEKKGPPVEELYEEMLPEDLVAFGLKPELIGRFPVLTYTKRLNKDAIIDIMKNGARSAFNQQLLLLREGYHLDVTVDEEVYGIVSDATLGLGTGARGLEAISNRLFEAIKFDIKKLTTGKTVLHIAPEMAYDKLKKMLPANYKF